MENENGQEKTYQRIVVKNNGTLLSKKNVTF